MYYEVMVFLNDRANFNQLGKSIICGVLRALTFKVEHFVI
ncbi:hypothetical protein JCM19233_3939 [Vibrio astriarenae]|nr:hypothetical protein JCM19233_3939 [Vibrio sp. C7]